MPSLVMRAPAGSLIEQTSHLIVRRQITYGASAWFTVGNLGIRLQCPRSGIHLPVLEFRRAGAGAETGPQRERRRGTLCNGSRSDGRTGGFECATSPGWQRSARAVATVIYEALDYTRSRLPEGKDYAVVRAFMAHHQGMTVVAIANALLDGEMRTRFHAEPIIQATELLLQEPDTARCRSRSSQGGGSQGGCRGPRPGRTPDGAPPALRARRDTGGPVALQRPLRGDAHGSRLRLQSMA